MLSTLNVFEERSKYTARLLALHVQGKINQYEHTTSAVKHDFTKDNYLEHTMLI